MKHAALSASSLLLFTFHYTAAAFERLALMDSLDDAHAVDTETKQGTLEMIWDCLDRTGADGILWRDKSGGGDVRYVSQEEPLPYAQEYLIDKRRNMPGWGQYWALRLSDPGFDVFKFVFDECARRKAIYGIHQTFEENHTMNCNLSFWNLRHPEFWNCAKDGVPWPGHVSLAFPEVMAHKLRFADEHIALKPQKIFLDMWRSGTFHLRYEYVKPNIEKWKKLYPGEPLPAHTDERWIKLCSEPMMAYLREYGRRCKQAGVEFVIGFGSEGQGWPGLDRAKLQGEDLLNQNGLFAWRGYGVDWKQLAAEGAIGGLWVMNINYDRKRPFETTADELEYIVKHRGQAKIYFGVNIYSARGGSYIDYAKNAGVSETEAVKRLMTMARDLGCAGVVYECIDWTVHPKDVCDTMRGFNDDEVVVEGENAVVSRDGRFLAFERAENGRMHLGVKNLATGEITWVARGETEATKNENACHPAWDVNGTLAYSYANLTNTAYVRFSRKAPGDGYALRLWRDGKSTTLADGLTRNFSGSFSPDARHIYFVRQAGGEEGGVARICRIDLAKPNKIETVLLPPSGDSGVASPMLSPDGKTLVWAELQDTGVTWKLYAAPVADTSKTRLLTPGDMTAYAPRWHPNGRNLVFTGFRPGDEGWGVYMLNTQSLACRRLVTGTEPFLTADWKWLYYTRDGKVRRFRLGYADVMSLYEEVKSKSGKGKSVEEVRFRLAKIAPGEKVTIPDDKADPKAARFLRFTFDMDEDDGRRSLLSAEWGGKTLMQFSTIGRAACFISREQSDNGRKVDNGIPLKKGTHRITCWRGERGLIGVSVDGGAMKLFPCGYGLMPISGEGTLRTSGPASLNFRDIELGIWK